MTSRLIDQTLFGDETGEEAGDGATLVGARCPDCSTVVFPRQDVCPACGRGGMRAEDLPTGGRLWGFTVQNFPPKPPFKGPVPFEPFGVGYVDLGDVVVEGRLTLNSPDELHEVDSVSSVLIPAYVDDDGTQVLTYAFSPEEQGNTSL